MRRALKAASLVAMVLLVLAGHAAAAYWWGLSYGSELAATFPVIRNQVSHSGVIAPDSLTVLTGEGFTSGDMHSAADIRTPPLELGGVRVRVGGVQARLRAVSATEISLLPQVADEAGHSLSLNPDAAFAWKLVEIETATGVRRTWAPMATVSPAVFTNQDGLAQGLAVIGKQPPFLIGAEPIGNEGQTRIMLFCTGVRAARRAWVILNDRWITATASADRTFPGIDSVVVELPRDLRGRVTGLIWADARMSNQFTFLVR